MNNGHKVPQQFQLWSDFQAALKSSAVKIVEASRVDYQNLALIAYGKVIHHAWYWKANQIIINFGVTLGWQIGNIDATF